MHDNLQSHLREHGAQPRPKAPSKQRAFTLALVMTMAVVIVPLGEPLFAEPELREP